MVRIASLASLSLAAALAFGVPGVALAETAAPPVAGQAAEVSAERALALSDLMMTGPLFEVLVQEGQAYGASIEEQMFPGQGGTRWPAMVAAIYDPVALRGVFDQAFAQALAGDPEAVAAAEAFFSTPQGQEIVKLEVEARRALLDKAVEEAAQVEAERLQAERDPLVRQLKDLIAAGDLIEMNVAGALSANLAFFQGMASVAGAGPAMPEEELMAEVWAQEGQIRAETANWLLPYLALAYRPLPEKDMRDYVAYWQSPEGKRLNAALFAAYDAVFREVSFKLGKAAATILQGNDI